MAGYAKKWRENGERRRGDENDAYDAGEVQARKSKICCKVKKLSVSSFGNTDLSLAEFRGCSKELSKVIGQNLREVGTILCKYFSLEGYILN